MIVKPYKVHEQNSHCHTDRVIKGSFKVSPAEKVIRTIAISVTKKLNGNGNFSIAIFII